MKALQEAIELGDVEAGMLAIPWDKLEEMETELTPTIKGILDDAAVAAEAFLPEGISIAFDAKSPESIVWVQNHCAELVLQNVLPEGRMAIRATIERAFEQGIPPIPASRIIRENIGILPRHAQAVNKFYESLVEEIGEQAAAKKAERYAKKLINYRAKNIARTETIRASNQGQQELWRQGVREGMIDPSGVERVWVTEASERTCPVCQSLNDTTAGLEEPFPGGYFMPPDPHPSCRCSVGMRRKRKAQ